MKVPTYTKQVSPSSESGGIRFNVSANPQGFSMKEDAQANLFGQLESSFTKLYQNEVKVTRDGELAKAQNMWTSQAKTFELEANNQPYNKMQSYFSSKELISNLAISSQITDKVVKKRFNTWRTSQLADYTFNLTKNARAKAIDIAKTNQLALVDNYVKEMSSHPVGSVKYKKAFDAVFSNKILQQDGTYSKGIIGKMIENNLMTAEDGYKTQKKILNDVARNKVNQLLQTYNDADDYKGARALLSKVLDPNDGDFAHLNPTTRVSLSEKITRIADTIQRQIIKKDNDATKKAEKDRKATQLKNFTKYSTQIAQAQLGEAGATFPTATQLTTALENNEIDVKQYDTLITAIAQDSAPKDRPSVIFAFNKELMDAQTEAEVLAVLDNYKSKIGLVGGLTLETWNAKMQQAQQFIDNTPFAQEYKTNLAYLKRTLGIDENMFSIGKNSNAFDETLTAEALLNFELKVSNKTNPVAPSIAVKEVLRNYNEAKRLKMKVPMISPKILKYHPKKVLEKTDIMSWTDADFATARNILQNIPSRKGKYGSHNGGVYGNQYTEGMNSGDKLAELQKINKIQETVKNQKRLEQIAKDIKDKKKEADKTTVEEEKDDDGVVNYILEKLGIKKSEEERLLGGG